MSRKTPPKTPDEVALRFISYRARSIKEVRDRLNRAGFAAPAAAASIERLLKNGYLDDEAFARGLASSRLRNRHWGSIKIAFALRAKGIADETVKLVLSEVRGADEQEAARSALNKWLRRNRLRGIDLGHGKELVRAMNHLRSHGFPTSVIRSTVSGLTRVDVEIELP